MKLYDFYMNSGIYQIINLVDDKRYVGSSINLDKREKHHFYKLKNNIHWSKKLQSAYNKYGKENFEFQIILYCDKENLIFYEQIAINIFDFRTELYNTRKIADRNIGVKRTDEEKEKISNAHRGRIHSLESRKNMSEAHKNPSDEIRKKMSDAKKGKKVSDETRRKLSKTNKGKKRSVDTCQKISQAKKGKKFSSKHCENIKKSKTGEKNHNYGKPRTENTKLKIGNANKNKKLSQEHIEKLIKANKGRKPHNVVLFNQDQIEEIKKLRQNGMSYKNISIIFKCSRPVISRLLKKVLI